MTDFDMPGQEASWEQRGGWVVRALMRDLGLTDFQAAGFAGNPGYESKGFTDLQEDRPTVPGSKGGAGWCQWTGYKPPNDRRAQFEKWCADHGLSTESDQGNYGFILFELRGRFKGFTARLKQCPSIEEACHLTHRLYETPSDVIDGSYHSFPDRLHWAQRALAGAKSQPGGTEEPAPSPGPVRPPEPPAADDNDPIIAGIDTIQLGLRQAGFYDGKIDGIFGKGSKAALDAFRERICR